MKTLALLLMMSVVSPSLAVAETVYEAGENGLVNVRVQSTGANAGINVISSRFSAETATHSFRLIHDLGLPTDEWVMLNSAVRVGTSSELRFHSMLGLSGGGEQATAQVSTNGGLTWTDVWSQTGRQPGETAFTEKVIYLGQVNSGVYLGQTLRVRFLYRWDQIGSWFSQPTWDYAGWFIDRIELTNIELVTGGPSAQGGTLAVTEDVAKTGTLVATGNALKYSVSAQGAKGTAAVTNANTGAFIYTPNLNANGTDSFTFKATDASGLESNVATVTVGIAAVNDSPVAQDGVLALYVTRSKARNGTLIATDVDGDALTYSIVTQGAHGMAEITNSATGEFTYTPDESVTLTPLNTNPTIPYTLQRSFDLTSWTDRALFLPGMPSFSDRRIAPKQFYRLSWQQGSAAAQQRIRVIKLP